MNPNERERWRRELLSRLDALRTHARHIQKQMKAKSLEVYESKEEFEAKWGQITDLFPDGFHPTRSSDLSRHIRFAMCVDFHDIENFDIPAVKESVERYGRTSEEIISDTLQRFDFSISAGDLLHPEIKDACAGLINQRRHREAARNAVELVMDEIRKLGGTELDGDALIRKVVGVKLGKVAFSDCDSRNSKSVTEGLKLVAQGLYKGVRNPASHSSDELNRVEAFQILATCGLLLARLDLVGLEQQDE